jgi:predicted DCC family thiol-disulfide oxidoreductase YuxK
MSSQAGDANLPDEHRWLVLYDVECGLCIWLLALLLRLDSERRLRPAALQGAEAERLLADLAPAERMASWHLISPQGVRRSAGAALPALLRLLRFGRLPAGALSRLPGVTERGYRWVADHRTQLSRFVPGGAKRRAARYVRRREQESAAM